VEDWAEAAAEAVLRLRGAVEMGRRAEITALHGDQILEVLGRLGVAAHYESGDLRCAICGDSVQERELGAIRLAGGEAAVACGRLECLEDFHG
jgi:hypothetical protein